MTNAQKESFRLADYLKNLDDEGSLKQLVDLGIASLVWYDYLQMWKMYQNYRSKQIPKMQAYENVAIDFNCSADKVQKVIYKLKCEVSNS